MATYRLINKEKDYDAIMEVNCSLNEMIKIIDRFKKSKQITYSPVCFLNWINENTQYTANIFSPILFNF